MPSTFAAIDKHTVTALRKGDVSALEKIFRADYDALIHVASKQLSDPTAASQVVENALVQVWDERGHLETPDELDKALHDAVQGYAVREQRRRAAQQGKPQAQPASAAPTTPDALWAKVVAGMNAHKADAAPKHQPVDPNRHHAAVHLGDVGKRSRTGPIIGGVLLIAVTAGILWWMNRKGEETAVNRSFSSPKASIASSAAAQRSSMSLSDSTTVRLGAESKVIVPPGYGEVGTGRVVKLDGTATFVVTASEANPFEVRAGTFAIVASGTEFTVRAYNNESIVTVRVKDGQVAIKGAAEARTLGAGSAIAIAKDGSMQEPSADALAHALAWTDGRFVIANVSLKELLPELKRWYPLDPRVTDKSLLERMASMNVSLDSTKAAIAALEKSASVKFAYEGVKTVLRDAGAPAKK
jgi:ferric-dicitrate binding protein FerR (iron transport regulator)